MVYIWGKMKSSCRDPNLRIVIDVTQNVMLSKSQSVMLKYTNNDHNNSSFTIYLYLNLFFILFPSFSPLALYISLPVLQGLAREDLPTRTLMNGPASKLMKYTDLEWSPPPM